MIKIILIDPANKTVSYEQIEDSREAIASLIGCGCIYFESVPSIIAGYQCLVDEIPQEGQFTYGGISVRGRMIVCQAGDDGDLVDIDLHLAEVVRRVTWGIN